MEKWHRLVAPLVGAWIEMSVTVNIAVFSPVAPLVGAWIEICCLSEFKKTILVAPLVGAWIEILTPQNKKRGK